MRRVLVVLALVLAAAACEEELTVPGGCPEFCPGGQPLLQDTTIYAAPAGDSTFFGYFGWQDVSSLLVANDFGAGEARAWYRFPPRSDSVTVSDTVRAYTVDSVVIRMGIVARDSTVKGLTFSVYQLPLTVDTTTDVPALDAMMTPDALVGNIVVPDSVYRGSVQLVLKDSSLARLVIPPADSGRLVLGFRIGDAKATGARLGSIQGTTGPAEYTTYVTADVADTTRRKQQLALVADANGFAVGGVPPADDPDLLYIGRVPAARSLLRFEVPKRILDSTSVVRATLELTPMRPWTGLLGDITQLEVRPIAVDVGGKSTPVFALRAVKALPLSGSEVIGIDVIGLIINWRGLTPLPQALFLSLGPEGGSFQQPVFGSSRQGDAPRLRITYMAPSPVERP
ncbi:MAG TPA: hypothetical protein VF862_08955 [Gemmatimonadales bacterium]